MPKKGVLDDPNNEGKLRQLISDYNLNFKTTPTVRIKDIHEHVLAAGNRNELGFEPPSLSWWKLTGKHLIDQINEVNKKTIVINEKEQIDIPDYDDLIDKYGGKHKELLKKEIRALPNIIDRYITRLQKYEQKISKLQQENEELKRKKNDYKTKSENLQEILLAIFSYTGDSRNRLIEMLDVKNEKGKAKNDYISLSIGKFFTEPKGFVEALVSDLDPSFIQGLANGTAKVETKKEDKNPVIPFPVNGKEDDDMDWSE